MYTPKHFASSLGRSALLERYGFGLLITASSEGLWTTHLPYVAADDGSRVTMHMARANPHWRAIQNQPHCRFVVQGAHGYVSPSWYESREAVPTWNYEAVHLDGEAELIFDEDELLGLLRTLVGRFEEPDASALWSLEDLSPEFLKPRLGSIVGVTFEVASAATKQKLSQNRSLSERRRVVEELRRRGNQSLADSIEELLPEQP